MSVKIFFCYAHKDKKMLNELKKHLKGLQENGVIESWCDQNINAGTEWEAEISRQLNAAQIILLLISADFMDSDYCYSTEMKRALERHEQGEARVIPIILRPTDRKGTSFDKLQTLPSEGKPVTSWRTRDEAFLDIALGIRKAVEELHFLEKSDESSIAEKLSINRNVYLKNEEEKFSSNSTFSGKVLNIPLLAENLEVDSNQLKKNLQDLYGRDVKELKVNINMYDLGANLIEVVEKICRGVESSELPTPAEIRPLLLKQIRNQSEHWPICFPAYEVNLATLLSKLVQEIFSSYNNSLHSLTIVRESIENTLEYIHYKLVAYLKRAMSSDPARHFGFPAIAAYLEKYEEYGSDQESIERALKEIYKYQNISVNSLQEIYLVASKSKSAGSWRVYFPNLREDDKMEMIMTNCQPCNIIDGYSWHVFFLPQVIGNVIMEISFGEGKRIEELTYEVGLNLKDYECVGLP